MKSVYGIDHLVIGRSKEDPGVQFGRVDELQDFLYTCFFKGITMDYSEFVNTKKTAMSSSELTLRRNRLKKNDRNSALATAAGKKVEQPRGASTTSSVTPLEIIQVVDSDGSEDP